MLHVCLLTVFDENIVKKKLNYSLFVCTLGKNLLTDTFFVKNILLTETVPLGISKTGN